jgi:hypothetical protein
LNRFLSKQELVRSYLSYSDAVFAYAEQLSKQIMGYEPRQILLLHANQLEADHIGELLDVMRKRGYRFVSLEKALADPAYSLPDAYVGRKEPAGLITGPSRWGKPPQGAPVFPQWVIDRAKPLQQPQP